MSAPIDPLVRETFNRAAAPRRVLIYAPLAYSTPHFETDLEIAQRHLDLGDNVELVLCDAELKSCQLNPAHETPRCVQCVSRSLQGPAQLSAPVTTRQILASLTAADQAELEKLPQEFSDQDALRHYTFAGFDAGMATLSSIIDFARTLIIDTRQHAELIRRTLHASVATFLAMKRLLGTQPYDRVYIYNGRWSMMRSAVRACEQLGITYYTHERGSDFGKFVVYRDVLPHDKASFRERTRRAWNEAAGHPATLALGEGFFHERRARVEKTWFSHSKAQEQGRLPSDWNRDARRLVLFTSSEFEYAAISGTAIGRIYPTQVAGLRCIALALAARSPASHLWVRVHPNDLSPVAITRWTGAVAGLSNVTLILPGESVDSYALMEKAERILTFGSTMGIEATFWGRTAICADFSFYEGLDAQYEATSEDELLDLLVREPLPPKSRECALRYGYYLNSFGTAFQYFVTEKISDYDFKSPFRGQCLKPDYNDLRQRLVALFQAGDFARAALVAALAIRHQPTDGTAHSIRVLSLLRLAALTDAIDALESAAQALNPALLEGVLKQTGSTLLDALARRAKPAPTAEFAALAVRVAGVLDRIPTYAPIAKKLEAMAARAALQTAG